MTTDTPKMINETATHTYWRQGIREQIWQVNGKSRQVFVLDGTDALNGFFNTIEDAQRFIRRGRHAA